MTAERRSAGLAAAARVAREELLDLAEATASEDAVTVVSAPAAGGVMIDVETHAGAFCACEVVVTTASVRVRETNGWACVLGFDREAALAAAILDARPDVAVETLAADALAREAAARAAEDAALAGTRV